METTLKFLIAHGLLSEDVPGVTLESAEHELVRQMQAFTVSGKRIEILPGKFKTAAIVFGFYKLHLQSGGLQPRFYIEGNDLLTILSYMGDATVASARSQPGLHPFIDVVLACNAHAQILIEVEMS